jgi:hypothetical protein
VVDEDDNGGSNSIYPKEPKESLYQWYLYELELSLPQRVRLISGSFGTSEPFASILGPTILPELSIPTAP